MPAFTAVGAYVAGTLLGLAGTAAVVVGAIVATGAAYITSRIINGNPNKGNNSASNQGGRIQVPPATNNKIPVLYGSAYINGIITDARLKSIGGTTNDTMYYCIVLSEYTNNLTTPSYGLESVLWNDLRLTAVDTTTNAHKVKDGRKVVDGAIVNAGSFVVGSTYIITKRGTTDFTLIGAQTNNIGQIFTATGIGSGTGQAQLEDFIDTNFIVDNKSLVELRVYAGSSAAADQIYPPQSSGNTQAAYDFWGNDDGSWDLTYNMSGLVFAIVKLTYNGDKGFTALPNVTFQLANNVSNPADVWYDYMTSQRYGAGIDPSNIDSTARTAWYNFCEEDISYTNVAGETNQSTIRYNINGILDTGNQVKTNIDTILQNGGAWMSYNVATGLWSPVIKKAVSAGIATESATLFTATRTGTTLTVTNFPSGRIEPGQRLYNSTGTLIGTISAQLTPTAGETTGQKGRYTTSTSGSISSTTFYTLPASSLEFSDDNIISGITISSTRLEDLYNQVEAEFYNRYNKDQRAYARVELDSADRNPNEPDNELRMSLDLVNNSMQADILGQMEMRQSRDDLVIEFTANHYGIQAQAGDVVAVTCDLYGWAPKYFRVMRVKEIENEDGTLTAQIQALEYNPDVYTIEPITEFSTTANIGIGNLVSSPGLPKPNPPVIGGKNPNVPVPYFNYTQAIPSTGGPFDEIEIYVTEGWDPNSVTGSIVPGTGSNGVPVGKGLMTVTTATYNSINVGDYFDLGGVTVESQLTQTTISTKTYSSGGAVGSYSFTLNNVTGVIIGQKPTGTGIPSGAMVVGVSGTTVTLNQAFTIQASGSYQFTTAGGTGTYQVSISMTASGTDDLYDQPINSDFKYLKKITPPGDASSFASGTTITAVITELPANSNTFRRWFLKSRLGWKKNFGDFSDNQTIDLDGNVSWDPNPVGGGGGGSSTPLSGVFTSVNINNTTPFLTFSTQPQGTNAMYGIRGMSALDDPWFVGSGSAGSDLGYLEIATGDNSGSGSSQSGGQIYVRQYNGQGNGGAPWYGGNGTIQNELILLDNVGDTYIPNDLTLSNGRLNIYEGSSNPTANTNPLQIYKSYTGTGTIDVGFGVGLQFNVEDTTGNYKMNAGELLVGTKDKTAGSESYYLSLEVTDGGAPSIVALETSATDTKIQGNLTLNYLDRYSTSSITANATGGDSTLTWNGTAWTFANPLIAKTSLQLNGTSSGSIKLSAGTAPFNTTYTLPNADGSSGQVLRTDGSGALSWVNQNPNYNLSVTSVLANDPYLTLTPSSGSGTTSVQFIGGSGIQIQETGLETITITNTTVLPNIATYQFSGNIIGNTLQEITSFVASTYRSAKYTITMRKGTDYQCVEALILHDGTTSYITTYANMSTVASLGILSTDIVGGRVRLLVTPATTGTLYVLAHVIAIQVY